MRRNGARKRPGTPEAATAGTHPPAQKREGTMRRQSPWTTILRRTLCAAGALLLAALPAPTQAQGYPQNRPITLVVPFVAGGGTDAIARDLARALQDKLGQSVVVDNKGGAGGVIAAQFVAKSPPDGHTLFFATSTLVTGAAFDRKLPYDVEKDLTPIALLGRGPLLVVVNKDTGIASIPQLIARAKAKPGELNYVSSGTGGILHLAGELFTQRTGVKMTHVSYRGSGPAIIDLLAGQGQVAFTTVPTILGQVRADAVRLIAATSRERSPLFPDTPTVQESGVADYDVGTWWSVMGPAGLPPEIVRALNTAVNDAAASPTLSKRFADEGATPFRGTPEAFGKMLTQELQNWRKVVQDGGLKLN
jgi:tripartite-type tricarboxylate transporter receptor subunit TctC